MMPCRFSVLVAAAHLLGVLAQDPMPDAWRLSATSTEANFPLSNLVDNNPATFWQTQLTPSAAPLPQSLTVDLTAPVYVQGLIYQPRQDNSANGNIGVHDIQLSLDNVHWSAPVASGTYTDDNSTKYTPFASTQTRYVRLTAYTEAGNRGNYVSAAAIGFIWGAQISVPPTNLGQWGPTIDFPVVPVAAAVDPLSNDVITWSSFMPDQFGGTGLTSTATFDGRTVSSRVVTNTQHDMFCPGISMNVDGNIVVSGGDDALKTSIFDVRANTWNNAANMHIDRGYQSSTSLSDGRIFTIGGSWKGGDANKIGEVYDAAANTWTLLPGCPVTPMYTNDAKGVYRQDNHGWLFGWTNGSIFQAGPSRNMNWYNAAGQGTQVPAGTRGNDGDAMNGNAAMYDAVAGQILTLGGSPNYDNGTATANAHLITIGAPNAPVNITQLPNLNFARALSYSVILPNGLVFIVGGQVQIQLFTDNTAVLPTELYNPASQAFTTMAPLTIPRTYHSMAILLPDSTVLSGGGGLCGACDANHPNAQIWRPPFLFNADGSPAVRPTITSVNATQIMPGASLEVRTATANVTDLSLLRVSSATHSVNTDQRRVPLQIHGSNGLFTTTVPSDPGVLLPGYWMLFAMTAQGTPSNATMIQVLVPH